MVVPKELLREWDEERNSLDPLDDFPLSRRCAWLCSQGHNWEARLDSRMKRGQGCPYCAGQRLWSGYNDLATVNPRAASLWSLEENDGIAPSQVFPSAQGVFICPAGHSFRSSGVRMRNSEDGVGCPKCSGREAIAGVNDLGTTHPEIGVSYHGENEIPLEQLLLHSNKKVKWSCFQGHEYIASPAKRTRGQGCPYCSTPPRRVLVGFNDLATAFPQLVEEWHGDNLCTPQEYTPYSNARVKWLCSACGHSWEAHIFNRSLHGTGCPACCNSAPTSAKEKSLGDALRLIASGLTWEENNRSVLSGKELDLYCAELNIAVEFNGEYWHSESIHGEKVRARHDYKEQRCRELGITLLVIWERDWDERPEECLSALKELLKHGTPPPHWMSYGARRESPGGLRGGDR